MVGVEQGPFAYFEVQRLSLSTCGRYYLQIFVYHARLFSENETDDRFASHSNILVVAQNVYLLSGNDKTCSRAILNRVSSLPILPSYPTNDAS